MGEETLQGWLEDFRKKFEAAASPAPGSPAAKAAYEAFAEWCRAEQAGPPRQPPQAPLSPPVLQQPQSLDLEGLARELGSVRGELARLSRQVQALAERLAKLREGGNGSP